MLSVSPVCQSEGEELEAGGLEQEIAVLGPELRQSGDPVAECPDHVDGAGQQVVELRDLGRLVLHQPRLGLKLLLRYLDVLKENRNHLW